MVSVELNVVKQRDSRRVTGIYLADGDTDREPSVAVMIKFCGFAYTLGDFVSS
jgi:hypothetical protein